MTDVAVDTLRLRGTSARRLARVAATSLPRALERALDGVDDVAVEKVSVVLDLDPDAYDDETLAVLWADAIRGRVVEAARAGGTTGPRTVRQPTTAVPVTPTTPSRAGDPAAAVLAWVDAAEPEPAVLPPAVLALGDPAVAAEVRARIGGNAWVTLSDKASRALSRILAARPDAAPPSPTARSAASRPAVAAPVARTPAPASGSNEANDADVGVRLGQAASARPAADLLAELAPLVADRAEGLDPAAVTRAAGLVLLYPWLADHCRRAEALHPALEPLDAREAALALVVEPSDPDLADDPLVAFLAGRPAADASERHRATLPRADEVAESAERVLASFAAVVPGFARSSARFVRDAWVVRLGVLDTGHDPALLTASTHPLDVVLPLLPHPVGLVKLPWSPPVTVRFR